MDCESRALGCGLSLRSGVLEPSTPRLETRHCRVYINATSPTSAIRLAHTCAEWPVHETSFSGPVTETGSLPYGTPVASSDRRERLPGLRRRPQQELNCNHASHHSGRRVDRASTSAVAPAGWASFDMISPTAVLSPGPRAPDRAWVDMGRTGLLGLARIGDWTLRPSSASARASLQGLQRDSQLQSRQAIRKL